MHRVLFGINSEAVASSGRETNRAQTGLSFHARQELLALPIDDCNESVTLARYVDGLTQLTSASAGWRSGIAFSPPATTPR